MFVINLIYWKSVLERYSQTINITIAEVGSKGKPTIVGRSKEMTEAFGVQLYEPQEVAKKLGIGRNKIYELLKSGEMGYVAWGSKEKRVTADQVKDFIARRTVSKSITNLYPKAV